ncbi:MAG: peptide ligase PGM1-related protein [Jatrophihabitantaceae bacterium]
MPALIVANSRTEEMVGELAALTPLERQLGGSAALRSLWFAHSGDVVVLPYPPREEYLAYVTDLTRTDPGSLTVLVPPSGVLGGELLTPDRTADPGFRRHVHAAVQGQGVDRVLAVYKDVPIAQFAVAVGLTLPGHAFSAQGGDAIVNSKAAFRAIAAGAGVPIAQGLVTTRRMEAQAVITELLAAGHSVIVKQEFQGGGFGNEILSPVAGVRVAGAPREVVLPDAAAVADYVARRWEWLTVGGRRQLVIERYLTGCDTVYAEYLIADDGPELSGTGEILMEPVAVGEIVPAQALTPANSAFLVESGQRLCRSLHAMGYRGYLSADAVLTPEGDIVFTETNGRISGSSHLHISIGARVLDAAHRGRRVLLQLGGWATPSFAAAVERLRDAGLAFDRQTGLGVVLVSDLMPDGTLSYCAVAEDLESARTLNRQLVGLFDEAAASRAAGVDEAIPV